MKNQIDNFTKTLIKIQKGKPKLQKTNNKFQLRINKKDRNNYYDLPIEVYVNIQVIVLMREYDLVDSDIAKLLNVSKQSINTKLKHFRINKAGKLIFESFSYNQLSWLSIIFQLPVQYFFPNKIAIPIMGYVGKEKRNKLSEIQSNIQLALEKKAEKKQNVRR